LEGFDELMVRNEAIHIFIGFFHDLVDQSAGKFEAHLLYLVVELRSTDLTISVSVEMREYIVQVVLSAVVVAVHAAGDKFVEIYLAVLVHVHHFQDPVQLVVA
jgi:hypothetical protein